MPKKKPIKKTENKPATKLTGLQALILEIKGENKKIEFLKEEAMARNAQLSFQYARGKIDRGLEIIEILKKFQK